MSGPGFLRRWRDAWFARPRRVERDGWSVQVDRGGRAGYVGYAEPPGRLRFDWEMLAGGIGVRLPTADAWDDECARQGCAWARGRRDEIVPRIAAEVQRLSAPGSRLVMASDGFDLLA